MYQHSAVGRLHEELKIWEATKAELLQEGISFLIHLFARDVLVM